MDSSITIRPAAPGDLDFIVRANAQLARETEDLELNEVCLRAGVLALLEKRAPGEYFIAECDGAAIGQLAITYEWSDWRNCMIWWIQSVYVEKAARTGGVFRRLYQHAREEASRAGAGGLRLYVDTRNTRAQEVYTAVGMDGGHYRVYEDMFQ